MRLHDPTRASLAVLGLIVSAALFGLAMEGNWTKFVRVGAAAAAYLGTVALWSGRPQVAQSPAPWWPFCVAGAAAGFVSGVIRPTITWRLVLVQVIGAALLIGTAHWLAVRCAPRLRAWLAA